MCIRDRARAGVRVKPESLEPVEAKPAAAAAPAAHQGAIPEGTVLGDGHIKFCLLYTSRCV